jgi:FkbM family methyltransferase
LDAGANVGYYTILMADLTGPDGRVIAAEPNPATHRLLTRNIDHNGFTQRTTIRNAALGATSGPVRMVMPVGEPKNAHVSGVDPASLDAREYASFDADATTVDDLDLPRLDFAKIDVEGAELEVWRGMQRTIERSPGIQVVMEVNCLRYADPIAFLDEIEARFPLMTIDGIGRPQPIDRDSVLNSVTDVMLYLR